MLKAETTAHDPKGEMTMDTTTTVLAASTLEAPRATRAIARYATTAARVLLGLVFFVFGADGFLHFVPQPDPSTLPPGSVAFAGALMGTGYMFQLIKGTEVIVGALLLANRFVPLALALLAPVIVNIVLFHAFLSPSGIGLAIVLVALQLFLAWTHRSAYRPMLAARA
jgi:uncharacterized membrane protein YphA (DoxX/SURF4 family)